jgi:hypothetical protein
MAKFSGRRRFLDGCFSTSIRSRASIEENQQTPLTNVKRLLPTI